MGPKTLFYLLRPRCYSTLNPKPLNPKPKSLGNRIVAALQELHADPDFLGGAFFATEASPEPPKPLVKEYALNCIYNLRILL